MKKILFLLVSVTLLVSSCIFMGGKKVSGDGNVTTQEKPVSAFTEVEAHGAIDVYVIQGELKPLRIETDANLQQYITVRQEGNRIIVGTKDGYNLDPTGKIKVYTSSPNYTSIDVSGACDIKGETRLAGSSPLKIDMSGAGSINMEVEVPQVDVDISGAGSVTLKGKTKDFSVALTGAANAKCYELLTENAKVDISGAGDAEIFASVKLDAEVSGAGEVKYKGNASSVNQQVSGAGSVKKVD